MLKKKIFYEKDFTKILSLKFKAEQELSYYKISDYTFFVFLVSFDLFSTKVCSVNAAINSKDSSKQRFNYGYVNV